MEIVGGPPNPFIKLAAVSSFFGCPQARQTINVWFQLKREFLQMSIRLSAPFALLAACCAGSLLAAGDKPPTRAESSDSGAEVVCRVEKVTGSRLGAKRVCLTRDQWREHRQALREELERAQTNRSFKEPAG